MFAAGDVVWIVSMSSMFAFLSVFWWALQRRREREAYYRYELARQLLEHADEPDQFEFLSWLKAQEALEKERRRQGLLLGALVTLASGVGILIMFWHESGDESRIGWLPVLIGASMLAYLAVTHSSTTPLGLPPDPGARAPRER